MTSPTTNPLLAALADRVLVTDGAMGTMLQAADPTLEDYQGLDGCNEVLSVTRPEVVKGVHAAYLDVGADLIETNTFGANVTNLGEYDSEHRITELSLIGAQLARQAADEASTVAQPRFVLGSMGPGTRLPSLGQIPFELLRTTSAQQVRGLLEGGVDALLVETAQDLLQAKAAIIAAHESMSETGIHVPVFVHVTLETTGTMLVGSDIGSALTAIAPLGVDAIGLNCATGPEEMGEHLRYLGEKSPVPVSVMPNAGLPELGPDGAVYPLGPEKFASDVANFVQNLGVRMVGGCCGTTPEHVRILAETVRKIPLDKVPAREPHLEEGVSSLYQHVSLRQDTSVLLVGERTNANGSKAFREAMLEGRLDDCVKVARDQAADGAHMLDLCVDYVGRDGVADMSNLAGRLATASTLPIMLDSTDPDVLKAGLEHFGGRCVVNSVNYEDGAGPESRFQQTMRVASPHGAAVVALCIDEEGQARTAEWKVRVGSRLVDDLCKNWGMSPADIMVDTLTFPITTGQDEVRRDALETIESIRQLTAKYPDVQTVLGVSNVSFGLNPAARQVLNSVFLAECVDAGLTAAIVHASKIVPTANIDPEHLKVALDLIYDRRTADYDPLQAFMALFEGVTAESSKDARAAELAALPIPERLARRIVQGDKEGLADDLDSALAEHSALDIVNTMLLDGMKTVGELFGSGQMQLPFVLQSAEVMKTAVAHLEPHMEKSDDEGRGKIVLATVKGDVHDIGKNLVDIILSNNGYEVVNIGTKQSISSILTSAEEHKADAVGMSGLLVKSTVIMKDNLLEMNDRGVAKRFPVLLGGAALTRGYVEDNLADLYHGDVYYARDAFDGLHLMERVMAIRSGQTVPVDEKAEKRAAARRARKQRAEQLAAQQTNDAADAGEPVVNTTRSSEVGVDHDRPTPPWWGSRIVKGLPVSDYAAMLDERATFIGQWGLKPSRGDGPSYDDLVATEGRPRLRAWIDRLTADGVLAHAAVVYGYFPCYSEGNTLHILEHQPGEDDGQASPHAPVIESFTFPRQSRDQQVCLSDYWVPKEVAMADGRADVIGLQLVTMGQPIADYAADLFAKNAYRDYAEVHGLGVQLTEALAEYWHRRVREELVLPNGKTMADSDPRDLAGMLKVDYRGARFSPGYPACPELEDRAIVAKLLQPERIGVELSEEFQLHPEQSTDAFVVHHPAARYFST